MHCEPVQHLHELIQSLFNNFLRHLLFGSSKSSFSPICKNSPWLLCPCYFMPQQLNGTQLICCRLQKKLSKWFQFKCDLLHFSRGKRPADECVSAVLSPAACSLPPLRFLLCRRASSNDLPPLCRAPSAWPWAEAICRLFVPVTSAPMGTRDYFSSLFRAPEYEPVRLWISLYVGVWWVRETVRRALAYTNVVVKWKLQCD